MPKPTKEQIEAARAKSLARAVKADATGGGKGNVMEKLGALKLTYKDKQGEERTTERADARDYFGAVGSMSRFVGRGQTSQEVDGRAHMLDCALQGIHAQAKAALQQPVNVTVPKKAIVAAQKTGGGR
jgi:hypothetical protein